MTRLELLEILETPGGQNKIISVDKIYPKRPLDIKDHSEVNTFRIYVEFDGPIPDKGYIQDVSVPISPYTLPAKKCFQCQRVGHSAITCKRKVACPVCAGEYTADKCIFSDKIDFKCATCNGNHKVSSTLCESFKEALIISGGL